MSQIRKIHSHIYMVRLDRMNRNNVDNKLKKLNKDNELVIPSGMKIDACIVEIKYCEPKDGDMTLDGGACGIYEPNTGKYLLKYKDCGYC